MHAKCLKIKRVDHSIIKRLSVCYCCCRLILSGKLSGIRGPGARHVDDRGLLRVGNFQDQLFIEVGLDHHFRSDRRCTRYLLFFGSLLEEAVGETLSLVLAVNLDFLIFEVRLLGRTSSFRADTVGGSCSINLLHGEPKFAGFALPGISNTYLNSGAFDS